MAFPSYTLGNNASSKEVWSLFWYAACYLNGNISKNEIDFGIARDGSATSKNLDPTKVKFSSLPWIGHDHASSWRISPDGLRRRHFDLTLLPVVWIDLQHGDLSQEGQERFLFVTDRQSLVVGGGGSGTLTFYASPHNAAVDVYPYRDITNWPNSGSYTIACAIAQYDRLDTPSGGRYATGFDYWLYYTPGVSTSADLYVENAGTTTQGSFNFMALVRYLP